MASKTTRNWESYFFPSSSLRRRAILLFGENLLAAVGRGPSEGARSARGARDRALREHRRSSSLSSYTSPKLARVLSPGMAPVLVSLRPSSEHILIVRAPGARDQHES
jgi:hypothetical protein